VQDRENGQAAERIEKKQLRQTASNSQKVVLRGTERAEPAEAD
jgi:hypothetical protein